MSVNVALLSSCPEIGNTFAMLGEHLGKESEPKHRRWKKCSVAVDSIALAAEVRELVAGSSRVVVGIHRDQREASMRTLQAAARSHQCIVVMTLEGFRGLIDFMDGLEPVERGFLEARICGVILVGDKRENFHSVEQRVTTTRVVHIGGIHWSNETCADMAKFIVGEPPSA